MSESAPSYSARRYATATVLLLNDPTLTQNAQVRLRCFRCLNADEAKGIAITEAKAAHPQASILTIAVRDVTTAGDDDVPAGLFSATGSF